MKVLNIAFEDKEYKIIEQAKKLHLGNWHDFFMDLAREYLQRMKGGVK